MARSLSDRWTASSIWTMKLLLSKSQAWIKTVYPASSTWRATQVAQALSLPV